MDLSLLENPLVYAGVGLTALSVSFVVLQFYYSKEKKRQKAAPSTPPQYSYEEWRRDTFDIGVPVEEILQRCEGQKPEDPYKPFFIEPEWRHELVKYVQTGVASNRFMKHIGWCHNCRRALETILKV